MTYNFLFSYAREDSAKARELAKYLKGMERARYIKVYNKPDDPFATGKEDLPYFHYFLPLLSHHFMANDELVELCEFATKRESAKVVPIILERVDLALLPLMGNLWTLPEGGKGRAVTNQGKDFAAIATFLLQQIKDE